MKKTEIKYTKPDQFNDSYNQGQIDGLKKAARIAEYSRFGGVWQVIGEIYKAISSLENNKNDS